MFIGAIIYFIWNTIVKNKGLSIFIYTYYCFIWFNSVRIPKLPNWSQYGKLEAWMLEHTGKSIMSGRADIWGRLNNLIDLRPILVLVQIQ